MLGVLASISKIFVWRVPGKNSLGRSLVGSTTSRRTHKFTSETMFPGGRGPGLERFKSVMAQILGTKEPFPLGPLTSTRSHFPVKALAEINIRTIVAPMAALLSGVTDPSVPIHSLHASFPDFLTDRDRSHEFYVDVYPIHRDLAFASFRVMMKELQFNMCDLPSSYLPDSDVSDLNDRVTNRISPELAYSCRFWSRRRSRGDHLSRDTKVWSSLLLSPDGIRIVSASGDKTIRLWRVTADAEVCFSRRSLEASKFQLH